jgi:SpoVK/Ycf46/Vps4 family AAA+-type ATPase
VLAATNHPWDVDTALRRPGRLDRTLLVLPPDEEGRASILTAALADRPVDGVNVRRLARLTDGYSGADLAHLVDVAAEHALQDSLRTGQMRPIGRSHVERAREEVRPSGTGAGCCVYGPAGGCRRERSSARSPPVCSSGPTSLCS